MRFARSLTCSKLQQWSGSFDQPSGLRAWPKCRTKSSSGHVPDEMLGGWPSLRSIVRTPSLTYGPPYLPSVSNSFQIGTSSSARPLKELSCVSVLTPRLAQKLSSTSSTSVWKLVTSWRDARLPRFAIIPSSGTRPWPGPIHHHPLAAQRPAAVPRAGLPSEARLPGPSAPAAGSAAPIDVGPDQVGAAQPHRVSATAQPRASSRSPSRAAERGSPWLPSRLSNSDLVTGGRERLAS